MKAYDDSMGRNKEDLISVQGKPLLVNLEKKFASNENNNLPGFILVNPLVLPVFVCGKKALVNRNNRLANVKIGHLHKNPS